MAHAGERGKTLQPYRIPMSSDVPGDSYSSTFSPDETGQPAIAVVEAIAKLTDKDFRDLKPLHSVIDTTRLNGLFEESGALFYRSGSNSDEGCVSVVFQYEGCDVTVEEGTIHVILV